MNLWFLLTNNNMILLKQLHIQILQSNEFTIHVN